jgi:hypothetical protein
MRPPVPSDEKDNTTMERLALCFILWRKDLKRSPRGTILCGHIRVAVCIVATFATWYNRQKHLKKAQSKKEKCAHGKEKCTAGLS